MDYKSGYTNIKICGLSQVQDIDVAVLLPIQAVGLVFYSPSSRFVSPQQAQILNHRLNGRLQIVALVVDPDDQLVKDIQTHIHIDIWQFHGNELPNRCQQIANGTPWMKAARIDEKFQLSDFCLQYRDASAWILDAVVDGYGGGGQTFNWNLISPQWIDENRHRIILSGGLNQSNVSTAIKHFRPLGVDVSSGVELMKGKKSPDLMQEFVKIVRLTDELKNE